MQRMVPPSRLAHVVFRTAQIKRMIWWYETVLAGHVVYERDDIAFLTYDDEHHRIAFIGRQDFLPAKTAPQVGFYHVAFAYARLVDLLDTGDRLTDAGIIPWRVINHGPTVSYYYRDPDANDVELQVDRFANAADATAFMEGEHFRRNPIGIDVDPKELRAKLQAGVPLAEIMRRADE
jgi:catechol-2,3-dioxygenase